MELLTPSPRPARFDRGRACIGGRVRSILRSGCILLLVCLAIPLPQAARAVEPAPVSTDELERLVHSLQDDASRQKLVEQLRGLIAAQRGMEPEKPAGATFINEVTKQVEAFSGEIVAGAAMVVDAPRLLDWASQQASDSNARRLWAEAAFTFTTIFGCGALSEWDPR